MKRKGLLASTLLMSLGGLVVDRVFLSDGGPGPAPASADTLMDLGGAALSGSARPEPAATGGPPENHDLVRGLISQLGGPGLPTATSADAFAAPAWLSPPPAPGTNAEPATPPAELTLSAIVQGRRVSAAVVNGTLVRVGQSRRGITLLSVDRATAHVRFGGRKSVLRLRR